MTPYLDQLLADYESWQETSLIMYIVYYIYIYIKILLGTKQSTKNWNVNMNKEITVSFSYDLKQISSSIGISFCKEIQSRQTLINEIKYELVPFLEKKKILRAVT